MRLVISALSASALLAAPLSVVPRAALAQDGRPALVAPATATPSPEAARTWGVLAALSGREWSGNAQYHRFVWSAREQRLVWEVRSRNSQSWVENGVFTLNDAGMNVRYLGRDQRLAIGQDGSAAIQFSDLMGGSLTFSQDGDRYRVQVRPIPVHYYLTAVDGWTGASLLESAPVTGPAAPRGPIIVAAAPEAPSPSRSGRSSRNAPVAGPADTPPRVRPAEPPAADRPAGPGPIVIASAPPPPAAMREVPRGSVAAPARAAAASSREALMQAQVTAQREAAARAAEVERQRLAVIAEQARQAEEARRAREAANAAAWSEGFAMVGAVLGGVAAGMQTGGDSGSITAGMAIGANLAAPNSEITAAANQNLQTEYQRFEAQREFDRQVIANMNDPNNPLTQQQRRDETARQERAATERADMEQRHREEREAEEREALMAQREAERETAQSQAREEQERADQERANQQRREAEAVRQREQDAERRRQEEEERRQVAERERQAREEEQRREAEARRQEQERQRAAAEAERTRIIDFREAVVLCSLTGPQAQFNNWTCEGPLQMTYINFERPNVAAQFNLISCSSYRELPRAGPYRAFGCGYGLHPTNPGASRNVPEMLGVFVDGRITFRCPRNISGVCRER